MKLKNAALSYNELCNKKYKIIVAKKGKIQNIDLSFNINQFHHLPVFFTRNKLKTS
jgi:hypothetical protein